MSLCAGMNRWRMHVLPLMACNVDVLCIILMILFIGEPNDISFRRFRRHSTKNIIVATSACFYYTRTHCRQALCNVHHTIALLHQLACVVGLLTTCTQAHCNLQSTLINAHAYAMPLDLLPFAHFRLDMGPLAPRSISAAPTRPHTNRGPLKSLRVHRYCSITRSFFLIDTRFCEDGCSESSRLRWKRSSWFDYCEILQSQKLGRIFILTFVDRFVNVIEFYALLCVDLFRRL